MSALAISLIYLLAMVIAVPFARRLGLGSVLGYLIAGIVLGPSFLGVLGHNQETILHLAEYGVIMMLFLIGLELRPQILWKLRGPIFILGTLQVTLTSAVLTALGISVGFSFNISLAAGLILSLSSTAIVLQTLQERGALKTTGGETSFAVLLFQDMAVIPMIAVFPLLGTQVDPSESGVPGWAKGILIIGAVMCVVAAGKFLVRPLFKIVATTRLRELSTAMALMLVLAITLLMNWVGLSPALGAFIAGVVLAESEYRHQLETDIEPFKGLLLGVFFISIGAGIGLDQVRAQPWTVLGILGAILALKWGILYFTGKVGKLPLPDNLLFAFALAQGGEFGFVLINYAKGVGIFAQEQSQLLTASLALSMFFAPLMIGSHFKWVQPRFAKDKSKRSPDEIEDKDSPVIIAGFGRFGQMVTRLLKACGIHPTVLDFDAEQIDILRRFGMKAYYGDASQMELLKSAGIAKAKLFVVAIDDAEKALHIVEQVRAEFPLLKILVRAYDRISAYKLIHLGVLEPFIETSGSALNLGIEALRSLGFPAKQALHAAHVFNKHNNESIRALAKLYNQGDEAAFVAHSRTWVSALENTMKSDEPGRLSNPVITEADRAWESAPRSEVESQIPNQ